MRGASLRCEPEGNQEMERHPITAPETRDIPLSKLIPSPHNVRRHPHSRIEALADNILEIGLLQNLSARAQLDREGKPTGRFEVTAGGGRLKALKLLVARKRIAKNAPVACTIREGGSAREESLAENVMREQLHPADQFEAFKELHDYGSGIDDIAARFGVTPRVVKERLKLGAVSGNLLDRYRAGELTLEQLMAFTVCEDHARQEEVWDGLSFNKSPELIRRTLLQTHVSPTDKRVQFVGLEAYAAAGGVILRDLFTEDGGGYVADALLLDRLARDKLEQAAENVRAEGWKWVEVSLDHPGDAGFGRIYPREAELTDAEIARLDELETELDVISGQIEGAGEADAALMAKAEAFEIEYRTIEARSRIYSPDALAQAGAFVFIDYHGGLDIARGYVRPEDIRNEKEGSDETAAVEDDPANREVTIGATVEEDHGGGYSERLLAELTAHRTMALRATLGADPELALVSLTHVLAAKTFYAASSCLEISPHSAALEPIVSGIADTAAGRTVSARHVAWAAKLPERSEALWQFVCAMEADDRLALLAHCVSLTVNGIEKPNAPRMASKHGQELAAALHLDMREYWSPTASAYLERVSKQMILDAVREGVSAQAAENITRLRKAELAAAAETLLLPTRWLPAILRTKATTECGPSETASIQREAAE
jgi:ParB family chromosome partitioning protein